MINRQNLVAVFMALLLTIFLLGCTGKQAETAEAPAVPEAAPEQVPSEMPVPGADGLDAAEAETVVAGEDEEPLPGEPPSEEDVTLEEPTAEGSY